MLIPSRRRGPDSARPTDARSRARRPIASTIESLESRQLLATAAPHAAVAPPVVLASAAPHVTQAQFEPLTGRVLVVIDGGAAGLNLAQLRNPANYSFAPIVTRNGFPATDPSRPGVGVVLAPSIAITGVSLTPNPVPGQPQSLVVLVDNNQPIRTGFYRFTIHAAGITDGAGRPLDGAYSGVFPSGNGRPGSDFVADLAVLRHSVQPALPVAPVPSRGPGGVKPAPVFLPTSNQTFIKIVGNNNRTSRLLGGGNAFVVALPHQNFPGRYRLPETIGGPAIRPVLHPAQRLR